MCGRYALAQEYEALKIRFGFADDVRAFAFRPRYNIAPSQLNPVIIGDDEKKLRLMRWGLVPHWAKDISIGNKLINARSETAAEKPSFRDSFRNRRCLVPATGFFEWKKLPEGNRKQPMLIRVTDQEIFAFAGLWSSWSDLSGKEIVTYAILTTEANEVLKPIHNRMPVIFRQEDEDKWLGTSSDSAHLIDLMCPYPSEYINASPISTVVNSPENDVPECVIPI